MGKKNSTSTSQVTIPPEVLARYNAVNTKAEAAAATPFQKFGTQPSDFVAQMNAQQGAGISDINATAGSYQPFMDKATTATQAGMGPAYAGINNYMSPYIQNVADTTGAMLRQSNEQAQSGALGQAVSSGAFGGDRAGIAAANLNQQNQMAYGKTMADIYNQGYTQALGASQADLGRQLQGGAQMGALGAQSQALGLQGAQAKIAAGTMQQQTEQAGKDAMINQFMQEKGYPFQVAQYLANIAMGTGAQSGTATTATQPLGFFGNLYASGGGVTGKADGGGVSGPMSSSQEPIWGDGYVPSGVLPSRDLMISELPSREKSDKSGDMMKLALMAMGAKNGGTIDARHGYAGGSTVTPEDMAEFERRGQAEATGVVVPFPTSGAPASQPAATSRAPTGVAAPTQPQQPAASGVAPRPAAEDPVAFFNNKIIRQESGGRQLDRDGKPLTSSAGAVGIAQVMEGTGPEAAKLAGVEWDRNRWMYDADYNKSLGQAYFLHQYNKYGSLDKASAAYNAGPGNLERAMARAASEGGSYTDYLPAETQNYLKSTAAMGDGASGVAGGSNLSISSSGGLGGADMFKSGKPYEDRNMIGRFFYNKDGTLNQNSMLSILSGLSTMASSNSISPITALLQGVGGGVNTYKELLTKAPEAVKANIANANELQTAYLRAQQLNGYKGTIEQFAKEMGWQGSPFGSDAPGGMGQSGQQPGQEAMFGAPFDFAGNGMRTKITLDGNEVYAGQSLAWLQAYKNWLSSQSLTGLVKPELLAAVDNAMNAAIANNGQVTGVDSNGNAVTFTDPAVRSSIFGSGQLQNAAERTQQILGDISTYSGRTQLESQKLDELKDAVIGMGPEGTGPISEALMPFRQVAFELGLANPNDDTVSNQEILRKGLAADALNQLQAMGGDPATASILRQATQGNLSGAMTQEAISHVLAVRAGINEYNKAFYSAMEDLKRARPDADLYQAELDWKSKPENQLTAFVDKQIPIYREAITNPPIPPVPPGADPELWASDPVYRQDWSQ